MSGKWVTKVTGKTPPVDDLSHLKDEIVTLLIQGKNAFGDDIYSYIELPIANIERVRSALASGQRFMPSDYGTVVAAGRGQPSEEIKNEVGKNQYMIYFEPTTLPNLVSPPKIWGNQDDQ